MRRNLLFAAVAVGGTLALMGCGGPPPVAQAPPVYNSGPGPQPMYGGGQPQVSNPGGGVYNWQDVPVNQQVPITRAVFDQGGYQIFAQSGETIVVPFVNQNLYALKFGQTRNNAFFVNEGNAPVLYLPPGGYLENAAAQNARWYPFPNDFSYQRPVYVSIAPTWADYVGMGWYPGMQYYGGMWGYTPYAHFSWMPGFYVNIGGTRYRNYTTYHNYYTTNRGYVPNRVVYNNYNTRTTGSFGSTRSTGSTGSFGSGRRTGGGFGSSVGSTGSFGSGRSNTSTSGGTSFGSGRPTGSFGSGNSSSGSSFGSGRRPGGSFGSGSPSYTNTPRSSGSSFGGGRSIGSSGSFGGGRSSSGGSTFGGGRSSGSSFGGGRSSGGSFGGGRRR